ncbi:hypothetical protein O5910_23695 [Escherichia coli]|nr:hypothetical protein [Escherichia coli]MCZ5140078.1 hypothetical protein [Escherichia coli]
MEKPSFLRLKGDEHVALLYNAVAVTEIPGTGDTAEKQQTGLESLPGHTLPAWLECQRI